MNKERLHLAVVAGGVPVCGEASRVDNSPRVTTVMAQVQCLRCIRIWREELARKRELGRRP